jgi:type I restriction-modification system DNA methylase subunit
VARRQRRTEGPGRHCVGEADDRPAALRAERADTRDVIEKFDFDAQIGRLDRAKLLYLVLSKVTEVDLHPDKVTNVEMGYLYEDDSEPVVDCRHRAVPVRAR